MASDGDTRIRVTVYAVREERIDGRWSPVAVVNREHVEPEREAFRSGRENFALEKFQDAVHRLRTGGRK